LKPPLDAADEDPSAGGPDAGDERVELAQVFAVKEHNRWAMWWNAVGLGVRGDCAKADG
jgi:hypothetical protein